VKTSTSVKTVIVSRDRLIYRPGLYIGLMFRFHRYIGKVGVDNAVIFLTHPDNMCKKAQQTKSRQLSCSNASRCVFI